MRISPFWILTLSSALALAQDPASWASTTMNVTQPFPYPYWMTFSGWINDGKCLFDGVSFSPYELSALVYVHGLAEYNCQIVGKSGKAYKAKVVFQWEDATNYAHLPGHEYARWSGFAAVQEDIVGLRILNLWTNAVLYEIKAAATPPVIEIKVRETGNGGIFWQIGQNLSQTDEKIYPIIDLTLSNGKSWSDGSTLYLKGASSSQNISDLLKPGMTATFRFSVDYDFHRYVKYYTMGKGFSDTAPVLASTP